MRFRLQVKRIQTAERTVSAVDEEAAARKVKAELDQPYGFFGTWRTEGIDIEVLSVESRIAGMSVDIGGVDGGPLLFSVKGAAETLGVSRGTLYELVRSGEIEHVRVGSRILISRNALERFIETNTHVGYV